jgi:hypothetical protein
MSTYTAIHIHSKEITRAQQICRAWLTESYPAATTTVTQGAFPRKAFAGIFDASRPSLLVLGLTQPDWITIHYDSFNNMEALAQRLSRELACRAVVVLAQTVSDSYYISVDDGGERVRTLEFSADEGWLVQEGTPLPFEPRPLGKNIAEAGEEPLYFFGAEEIEAYCQELGFSLWGVEYEPAWVVMQARKKRGFW